MGTTTVTHKTIALSLIDVHARNYQRHPPEQLERLRASLIRFSQVRSIVVQAKEDGRYRILAGHGIASAALGCGIPKLHCNVVPDTWDEATCNAYLVADNELDRGVDKDDQILAELLKEQVDSGYALDALGIQEAEFAALIKTLQDHFEPFDDELRESMTRPQGRVAELPDTSKNTHEREDGVRFSSDPDQTYMEEYAATTLRQIVLVYQFEDYNEIMRKLIAVRKSRNLDTNAAVVELILAFYLSYHPEEEAYVSSTG